MTSINENPFAVGVCFQQQNGYWSKKYHYKSLEKLEKGDIVVVPTKNFYSVGKVVECLENYTWDPAVNYRFVLQKLTLNDS